MYPEDVRTTFQTYPPAIRTQLLGIRELILATASQNEAVGDIEETLKWGEPAYLTSKSKAGTTIRLGWKESTPNQYRVLVHCQTNLIDTYRTLFPELKFDGDRAIVFSLEDDLPKDELAQCIEIALTYHLRKRGVK